MAGSSRDRVTIDLRGIGDAVRTAAAGRGQTVAAFARQALVASTGPQALAIERLDLPASGQGEVACPDTGQTFRLQGDILIACSSPT